MTDSEKVDRIVLAEFDAAVVELRNVLSLATANDSGSFSVLKCVYDTNRVAILKDRRVYRLSDEVEFKRVMVVTVDHSHNIGSQSYGPIYIALPERLPEINVTRNVTRIALMDAFNQANEEA